MTKELDRMKVVSKKPLNAETPLEGLQDQVTANSLFYVRNHFEIPDIHNSSWKLELNIQSSIRSFSLEQLKTFPTVSNRVVLECAGNGRSNLKPAIKGTAWGNGAVAQADFKGIPLRDLLLKNGRLPDNALEVVFTGADFGKGNSGNSVHYARSLPVEKALDPDILLVWEMNGEPLPLEHGFPLRLVVPNYYGMASVKWLNQIEVISQPFSGHFQANEYVYKTSEAAESHNPVREMRVSSLITSHGDGDVLTPGQHMVGGIAWSGNGDITEVAVSQDKGTTWSVAEINVPDHAYSWTSWRTKIDLAKQGDYYLTVCASDETGAKQPLQQFWNFGGYGNNMVQQIELKVRNN